MTRTDQPPRRAPSLLDPLRDLVASGIRRSLGGDLPGGLGDYEAPLGDEGLFGPDSMAWKVHADLPGMLIGGIAALMFQTLHPLAMAGVAAHSRFREDPLGRLQRTARFVAGTTYGPMPFVDRLVAEVRAVHRRVEGTAPDGRHYSASDPELLTFVHVTEVWSFLAAYQRYSASPLLRSEKDRYFEEMAEVARRLGARDVPTSLQAVREYLRAIEPELSRGAQADEALAFLSRPVGDLVTEVAAHRIVHAAAVDLLWRPARRLVAPNGVPAPPRAVVRAAAGSLSIALRWAIGPSPLVATAERRARMAN